MAEAKSPPQNIQDAFLNTVRREKTTVTIYLLSGAKLLGTNKKLRQVLGAAGIRNPGAVDFQTRYLHHLAGTTNRRTAHITLPAKLPGEASPGTAHSSES